MAPEKNPYLVLRVHPTASEQEIRRAYRRLIVRTHRSGVLDLVERIKEISGAYESLKDPLHRRGIRDAIANRPPDPSPKSPARSLDASPGVRSEAARETERYSNRVSAQAHRENAPIVKALSNEFDQREAAERKTRPWRKRREIALRVLWLSALVTLAIALGRRFLGF